MDSRSSVILPINLAPQDRSNRGATTTHRKVSVYSHKSVSVKGNN